MPATPSPYCVLSQDQRCLQTAFSRPTPFSDVLCLETSVFRRELSLNGCLQTRTVLDGCLQTWHVFRHGSEDVICLGTAVSRQYLSGDTSRLKTLVSRHITSGNTRLKTVYVLRVYISAPRTPLTFSKCILSICTEYRPVLASATQFMFSNLQGKTSATGTTIGENIRREMGIANLDSMKDTPTISLPVFLKMYHERMNSRMCPVGP